MNQSNSTDKNYMAVSEIACNAHAKAAKVNFRMIFLKPILDNPEKEQLQRLPSLVSYDQVKMF